MSLNALPIKKLGRVFHVGSMNPAHKGVQGASQEGNGLSVSIHPRDWTRIARLGGNPTFELTRNGGQFLHFHKLGKERRLALGEWGVAQGWLKRLTCWELKWRGGEEGELQVMPLYEEQSALDELEAAKECDENARLKRVDTVGLTPNAQTRLGFKQHDIHALSMAATFFVEDETLLDGVWWQDVYDPWGLSAPRGVIALSRLSAWTVTAQN